MISRKVRWSGLWWCLDRSDPWRHKVLSNNLILILIVVFVIPEFIGFSPLAVAKEVISPEKEFVEQGRVAYSPSDKIMKPSVRFIKGAGPDTVGAICSVGRPECQAGFRIDRPSQDTFPIWYIIGFIRWFSMGNRFAGTFIGTLLALQTKIPDTEFNGPVGYQRHVCKNLGQSNPGAEFRGDQQAVSGQFPQPGINGNGNAAGRIISTGDGFKRLNLWLTSGVMWCFLPVFLSWVESSGIKLGPCLPMAMLRRMPEMRAYRINRNL